MLLPIIPIPIPNIRYTIINALNISEKLNKLIFIFTIASVVNIFWAAKLYITPITSIDKAPDKWPSYKTISCSNIFHY